MLSNIGHGGYQWRHLGSLGCPISADMVGFSTIVRYVGTTKRPVWRDFGSPPSTTLNVVNVIPLN